MPLKPHFLSEQVRVLEDQLVQLSSLVA
ncbi:hypothetical protein POUND7_014501 [Theobroma cacao]